MNGERLANYAKLNHHENFNVYGTLNLPDTQSVCALVRDVAAMPA